MRNESSGRIFGPHIGWSLGTNAPALPAICVEVTENDKAYHVKAELPGVKKEDISCEIEGHEFSISAQVTHGNKRINVQ